MEEEKGKVGQNMYVRRNTGVLETEKKMEEAVPGKQEGHDSGNVWCCNMLPLHL